LIRFGWVIRGCGMLAVIAATGLGCAVTAASVLPTNRAGDGKGPVSGYSIASTTYNLDATNPQDIDSITLTLSTPPGLGSTIKVGLAGSTGGTNWYTCSNSGLSVNCPTTIPQATAWGVTSGGSATSGTTSASGTLTLVIAD
jgi:hypothetical protein